MAWNENQSCSIMNIQEDCKVSLELCDSDQENEFCTKSGESNGKDIDIIEKNIESKSLESIDLNDFTNTDGSGTDFDGDSDTDISSNFSDNEIDSDKDTENDIADTISLEVEIEDDFKEKAVDNIIAFFKVKRPTRFIDKESVEDEVSYEESEIRLIRLLGTISFILVIFSTIFSVSLGFDVFKNETKRPWDKIPENKGPELAYPTFNFILLDHYGNLESHQLTNLNTLKFNYRLKLPKARSYFLFADRGDVYVAKSKGNSNNLKITKLSSDGKYRIIADSELPVNFGQATSGSFRLGNLFWVYGSEQNDTKTNFDFHFVTNQAKYKKSYLWSFKKQKWFKGLLFDRYLWKEICGMSINRTFGLIIGNVAHDLLGSDYHGEQSEALTPNCVGSYLLDITSPNNFKLNYCFQLLHNDFIENDEVSCTSLVAKDGSM